MARHNGHKSVIYSQVTATISVALVLTLVGLIAIAGLTARNIARQMTVDVGLTVVLADSVDTATAQAIGKRLNRLPAAASVAFTSRADVLRRWQTMAGIDTILASESNNPFLPEWDVKVRDRWASADSLQAIASRLRQIKGVEEVTCRTDMADAAASAIHTVTLILIIVAAVLGLISFFLISNTIRLSVYARRHSIRAMRLVGAKNSFIRRPFVGGALMAGLVAASAASALVLAGWYLLLQQYPQVALALPFTELVYTIVGLYLTGSLICVIAATFATNRYLRRDADNIN